MIFLTALLISSSAVALMPKELRVFSQPPSLASVKTFEVESGHHSLEQIRIETRKIEGRDSQLISYFARNRRLTQLVLPPVLRAKVFADFEAALPAKLRARLLAAGPCGQTLNLRYTRALDTSEKRELLCLDTLPPAQNAAVAKWWKETRSILGL